MDKELFEAVYTTLDNMRSRLIKQDECLIHIMNTLDSVNQKLSDLEYIMRQP